MLLSVGLLVLGLILLLVGAEWLVRGASVIGLKMGLTPLLVGLVIVAFGTSVPELLVALKAGFAGKGDIAIGNVVGSNIANIALILGVAALIRPLEVQAQVVRREVPLVVIGSILLAVLLMNDVLGRFEGLVLFFALIVYLVVSVHDARAEANPAVEAEYAEAIAPAKRPTWQYWVLTVIGLAVLAGGAWILVDACVDLARLAGVSEALIALTIIAIGTSLPELATSAVASWKDEGDIAVGNVLGSNLFNILAILGISALIIPLHMGGVTWIDIGVMVAIALLAWPLLRMGLRVTRIDGAILLGSYVAYMTWLVVSLP
jgi:cation:H+ antiporter